MAIWDRIGRTWRTVAVLGVGVAGGATAAAVASVPDSNGVIHACVSATVPDSGPNAGQTVPITNAPNLTVIDPGAGQTCTGTVQSVAWNVTGPQGPPGQTGPQGPPGQTGTVSGTGAVIYNLVAPTIRASAPGIGTATIAGLGSFPLLSETTASPRAVGRATVFQLSLSKSVDNTSARLHDAVATGKHFASATIVLYRISGVRRGTVRRPGVVLKLRDVTVSSIQTSSTRSGASPVETLTLLFATLTKISK